MWFVGRILAPLFLSLSLSLSLFALTAAPAAADPFLRLDLNNTGLSEITVLPGEGVGVDVSAFGIPPGTDPPGLFGFGFSLLYDGALILDPTTMSLTFPMLELGALWDGTGFDDSRNDPGDAGLTSNRFFENDGPFGDDILLGSVIFGPLKNPGVYLLELTYFTDVGDNLLFDGTVLDSQSSFFRTGQITVLPEPATTPLILAGLAVLAAKGRSRSKGPKG
jgi:hypothetical protein